MSSLPIQDMEATFRCSRFSVSDELMLSSIRISLRNKNILFNQVLFRF